MVQTKLTSLVLSAGLLMSCAVSPEYEWKKVSMDGHITGVRGVSGTDSEVFLGFFEGEVYHSPSGKSYDNGSTPSVARALIDVQPSLLPLKEVLGVCPGGMGRDRSTGLLPRWTVDAAKTGAETLTGKKIDVAFYNYGGIRKDLPSGNVLLDDIVSIFPFQNYIVYTEISGEDIMWNLSEQSRLRMIWSSDMKVVAENGEIKSVEIGGKPLQPDRFYRIATIDFLLDGGDGIYLARNARRLVMTECLAREWFERYIRSITAEGKYLESSIDDRYIVK